MCGRIRVKEKEGIKMREEIKWECEHRGRGRRHEKLPKVWR